MLILITILHVLVSLFLILAVLLQSGKGGGLAAAIGGGLSSSSVLGGRSATSFLSKATTILATVFMISCLLQAVIIRGGETTAPTTALERVRQQEGAIPFEPFSGVETLPREGEAEELFPPAGQEDRAPQ